MKELTGKAGNHPGLSRIRAEISGDGVHAVRPRCLFCHPAGPVCPLDEPGGRISFSDVPAYLLTANRVYWVLDILGRAAFPLFCFLLAEGAAHTRSRKAYLLTLLAFAAATEPVYDWTHYGTVWNGALQNVLFTLTISCGQLWVMEIVRVRWHRQTGRRRCLLALTAAAAGALALLVRGEYVFLGHAVGSAFLPAAGKGRLASSGAGAAFGGLALGGAGGSFAADVQRAAGKAGRKYFFYVFYRRIFWC